MLEQKKTYDTEALKVHTNKFAKNYGEHSSALQACQRYEGGAELCGLGQHKVAHILLGHDSSLNFEKEVMTRTPIVDSRSNLKMNQDSLNRAYLSH